MAKSLTKEENILLALINAFQNDEKEKLNSLGNISKSLIEVRKIVKEEMEKLPPQFNILESIKNQTERGSLSTFETYNSDLFYQLFNIKKEKINFVKLFLEFINDKFESKIDLNNIDWKKATVGKEYGIKVEREDRTTNRRIDLIIYYNDKEKSFAVIIENKTKRDTGDQDSQIKDYYDKISKNYKNVYAIYLTPEGKLPSEKSLPKNYYDKKLYGKFANIRHAEIGYWLEGILKRQEFSFLNNEEENNKYNYKLLKSALIQMVDNEKSISGENEEIDDMTKDEIKEFLNVNLFNDIKTVDKAQEYIDMFNKANELLEEHKKLIVKNRILQYLDFTRKIYNNLVNKDVYWLLPDTEIIDNILNNGYSHNLEVNKKEVYLMIEIATDDLGGEYYFGILTGEPKFQNKLREKINEIKKRFDKFCIDYNFRDCEGAWVYYYHIDIERDKPEEIANAIDKLYDFLKTEIK